ncbi:MAG TPA: rhomboid family intramembrane serine protease [Anaerolineaceae bacterium]|nr:rhomboid family intramembrane serine protease [Anaerolineaceae bacterium]
MSDYPDSEYPGEEPRPGMPPAYGTAGAPPVVRPAARPTPYVTYAIMGVTAAVFLLQLLAGFLLRGCTIMTGCVDLVTLLGFKVNSLILSGQVWRLITPVLLHGILVHIGFNMYALFILGPGLERVYGHGRFLLLYLVSAFAGNVFSFLFSESSSLGASTAIFGLVAAQGVFVYLNRGYFRNPAALIRSTVMVVVINLILGLSPTIDNFGHLGGLLGGLLFAYLGGPKLTTVAEMGYYKTRDTRGLPQTLLAAAAVVLLFAVAAWTRFV